MLFPPRAVPRLLQALRSAMTLMVAATTSAQSAAFDTVSIVPSIRMQWTTLPTTITIARSVWAMRHVRSRSPKRPRSAASSATAKIAHIAITPQGENGVGDEKEKGVNHVRGTGDPKATDVDDHSHDQCASNPAMRTPPNTGRQSRQISANQQRLKKHDAQCDNSCEPGQYVNRIAPCEQRACRCSGDRHANACCKAHPDQGHLGRSPSLRRQSVRPAEARNAPLARYPLRSASPDVERRF